MPADKTVSAKFLVNFLRDRDFYHVPAALHAHGLLGILVTDIYFDPTAWWKSRLLPGPIKKHLSPDLPAGHTGDCLEAAAIQFIGRQLKAKRWDYMHAANRLLDAATARRWRRQPSNLLLYSQYAASTFEAAQGSDATKILFLYHPHYRLIGEILRADAALYPEVAPAVAADHELNAHWRHDVEDREIRAADAAITTSTFSRRSLEHAGFRGPVKVVPYCPATAPGQTARPARADGPCRFLFVGQGIQRKGLHHLFRAWAKARPANATLTCVCALSDPHIIAMAPPDVRVVGALSRADLDAEFSAADVFVMPSLAEGFGLVYVEALAHGLFVIGAKNSGLPDLKIGADEGVCLDAGDLEQLADALGDAARRVRDGAVDRAMIARRAGQRSFEDFGDELAGALADLTAPV